MDADNEMSGHKMDQLSHYIDSTKELITTKDHVIKGCSGRNIWKEDEERGGRTDDKERGVRISARARRSVQKLSS